MLKKDFFIFNASGRFLAFSVLLTIFSCLVYPLLLIELPRILPQSVIRLLGFIPFGFVGFVAIKFILEGNIGMAILFTILLAFSFYVGIALREIFLDN